MQETQHSNVLAWRIPGTGEPDGLPFTGLHRVKHDWSDLAEKRKWGQEDMRQVQFGLFMELAVSIGRGRFKARPDLTSDTFAW